MANTYEGRQAQQQAYLQSVQMQKQQMQMDDAMRKQATNSNIKPQAYDPNAKAATNRAINETRNAKASREAIWEEKRRRHLANRSVQQTTSNIRQPAQNLQQNYRGNPARTVQEVQPRQVKPAAGTYAGQLDKQISDRKQINLQNDSAQQSTTSMGIGSTVTHTDDMNKKKAAQQEYASALRSQMAMQEQRKQEEKRLQRHPNQAQYQQNVQNDRAMEDQRRRKHHYRQELDAQMRFKKESELRNRSGVNNEMPGGGGLHLGQDPRHRRQQNVHDPLADAQRARQIQYKQELDAQRMMKKQSEINSNMRNQIGGGGIMNQIGNNRQPYDGRRGRVDHFNTTEDQDKIRKKQEQQAYLQQLDIQMRMKKEREAREKKAIQDEERKYMAIGQNGVNNQQVSAQQEMFSRAGGINTSLQPPGGSNYQQNRAGMAQYQPLSNNIPQQQQSQPLQQQQMPAFSRPQQTSNIGMPQGLPTSTAVNYNAPRSGRPIPQNYHDHLNNHMGLRHSNGDANQIYKQRFRDGIKDPAEIDALRERHAQQAKQNQLLAQQVADNKRRKEEALRKKKEEELAEEQRLQRQRDELKKQYEDEVASQKAKKEAQQKAMLDEQIQSKRKQKEAEARRERERVKKENERIQRDRAEMAKQYERETGKSPPKAAPQGVSQTPIRQRQPMKQQTGRGDPRGPSNTASDSDKTMTRIKN